MRNRGHISNTHNISNTPNAVPLQAHLPADYREFFQITRWNNSSKTNQKAAALMSKFTDLVVYECPINQVMSRVPMMLRLSGSQMDSQSSEGLIAALGAWTHNQSFYSNSLSKILAAIEKNSTLFDQDSFELYKASCLSLIPAKEVVCRAHDRFATTISGLLQGGFTLSAIRPVGEGAYYRVSA